MSLSIKSHPSSGICVFPGVISVSNYQSYKEKTTKWLSYYSFYGGHILQEKLSPIFWQSASKKKKKATKVPIFSFFKWLQHTGNLFRKNRQLMSVNSRLQAIKIIGQRKAFYSQRIPESSCVRNETVDIDILATSRNGDRKIMQSIRITSRPPLRKRKWNQLSQFWRTSTKVIPIEKT